MIACQIKIRYMIHADLPRVLEIEEASFPNAWAEEDFKKFLPKKHYSCKVATAGNNLVGYMIYDSEKILNFAVHACMRRQGIGTQMIDAVKEEKPRIELVVYEYSLKAQHFWRAVGFTAVKCLRRHYGDKGDGILFSWERP